MSNVGLKREAGPSRKKFSVVTHCGWDHGRGECMHVCTRLTPSLLSESRWLPGLGMSE